MVRLLQMTETRESDPGDKLVLCYHSPEWPVVSVVIFWCRVRESNPDHHPGCNFFVVPLTGEVRTRQRPVAEELDMSLYAIIAKRCVMPRGSVSRRMCLILALQLMERLLAWLCAYHKSHG